MFRQRIYDGNLVLRTGTYGNAHMLGYSATSGMATNWNGVSGLRSTTVVTLDVGSGWMQGAFVIQLDKPPCRANAVVGTGASGQAFAIELRGANNKTFLREVSLAGIKLSMSSAIQTRYALASALGTLASTTHEFVLPFCNEHDGTTYQYLRCYHQWLGTWATGINYKAWISKL